MRIQDRYKHSLKIYEDDIKSREKNLVLYTQRNLIRNFNRYQSNPHNYRGRNKLPALHLSSKEAQTEEEISPSIIMKEVTANGLGEEKNSLEDLKKLLED